MSSHHSSAEWEKQLQAAERQYSDFFPDLELPPEPQAEGLPLHRTETTSQVDTSTLFCEHAFMNAVAGLGVSSTNPTELAASGTNVLDDSRRYSHASIGQMELMDELDAALQGLVVKTCRVKNQLLMPQYFPQQTLDVMRGELAQWGGELDKLQFERVDSVPTQPVSSGEDTVRRRRKSINLRCLRLKDEVDNALALLGTVQALQDGERALRAARGLHYDERGQLLRAGDLVAEVEQEIDDGYHESLRIPLLDQIDPDWADMIALQKRLAVCPLGRRYTQALEEHNLPLCDALYEYLQDPPAHAHTFALCNYHPQPGELAFSFDFLCSSKKLRSELKKLVLYNCLAGDEDCRALARHLPQLTGLGCLCLKQNNITSEGVGYIMQTLANCNGLQLDTLQLDGNMVEAAGVVEITLALPFCPLLSSLSLSANPIGDLGVYFLMRGLMNKKRRAIRWLPIPANEEEAIVDLIREFDLHFEEVDNDDATTLTPTTDGTQTSIGTPISRGTPTTPYASSNPPASSTGTPTTIGTPPSQSDTRSKSSISSLGSMVRKVAGRHPGQVWAQQRGLQDGHGVAERKDDGSEESPPLSGSSGLDDGLSSTGEAKPHACANKPNAWQRLKVKLMAVAAFNALGQRGHPLQSLRLEQCGLTPASAGMIAHMLRDNNLITDIFLNHNPGLLVNPAATKAFADLLASANNHVRVLGLKETGIDDESVRQLTLGINHKNCKDLAAVDVTNGSLGSLGAAWLAGCTKDMFFDQLSMSSVPSKSYAVDLL